MTNRLLTAIVIVQFIIIVALSANSFRVSVRPELAPVQALQSPLEIALEYESSDRKFEELVRVHADWVEYKSPLTGMPVLASCAMLKKTNYVTILIKSGADVGDAVEALENIEATEAIQLMRTSERELKKVQ